MLEQLIRIMCVAVPYLVLASRYIIVDLVRAIIKMIPKSVFLGIMMVLDIAVKLLVRGIKIRNVLLIIVAQNGTEGLEKCRKRVLRD